MTDEFVLGSVQKDWAVTVVRACWGLKMFRESEDPNAAYLSNYSTPEWGRLSSCWRGSVLNTQISVDT